MALAFLGAVQTKPSLWTRLTTHRPLRTIERLDFSVTVVKFLVCLRLPCLCLQEERDGGDPWHQTSKDAYVPSIRQDRSSLQSRDDTLPHSDRDISPRTAVHVYQEDTGPHSWNKTAAERAFSFHLFILHMILNWHFINTLSWMLKKIPEYNKNRNIFSNSAVWWHGPLSWTVTRFLSNLWANRLHSITEREDAASQVFTLLLWNLPAGLTYKAPVYPAEHVHSPVTWWQDAPFWHWHFCWQPLP